MSDAITPPADPRATVNNVAGQDTRRDWEDAVREMAARIDRLATDPRAILGIEVVRDIAEEMLGEIRGGGLRLGYLDRPPESDAE